MSALCFDYLKVVVAECAIEFTFLQTTVFEISDLNRKDTNRCDRVFQLTLYRREQFSNRV